MLLGGCFLLFRAPLTPRKGGPPWIRLTSEHFVVETDSRATAPDPRPTRGRATPRSRNALRRPPRPLGTPIEVVLFERAGDFGNIAGQKLNASAFFRAESPADNSSPARHRHARLGSVDETRMTAQHELTHRFLHERFASLPAWLDEGLAVYYESAGVEGGRVVLGARSHIDLSGRPYSGTHGWGFEHFEVPLHLAPSVRELVDADRWDFYGIREDGEHHQKETQRTSAFYAASWRLVHLLMNGPNVAYRTRFTAFLDDLGRGAKARSVPRALRRRLVGPRASVPGLPLRGASPARQLSPYRAPARGEGPLEELRPRGRALAGAHVMPWTKDGMGRVREQLDAAHAADPHRAPGAPPARDVLPPGTTSPRLERAPTPPSPRARGPRALFTLIRWHRRRAEANPTEPEATP